jgi:hypothetical protein
MKGKIRLYESFIIFVFFAFGAMVIFYLSILYKRIQKIIEYNNNLERNLVVKLERLFHLIDNLSSLIYKMDNTNSDNKSYLKKNSSDLDALSEKIDSNLIKIDKILHSESHRNYKSSFLISGHKENKTDMDKPKDIKNTIEEVKEQKIKEYEMDTTNFDINSDPSNSSMNELKSLENDILIALKRLEKEGSNSKQ